MMVYVICCLSIFFHSVEVSEWMFELAGHLSNLTFNADSPTSSSPSDRELPALSCLHMSASHLSKSVPQGDSGPNDRESSRPKRVRSRSDSSVTSNSVSSVST